ncbi:MAG: gliding motility protein GldL [Breznakibacter sp.]
MSLTELVESPGYKKLMGKVYGWGAAVVLAGALFKIMHYPGAELMLILGMGTEIIIFFLSAFEPPHAMPDWSLVYPELVGLEPLDRGTKPSSGGGGGSELAALIQSGHLDQDVVQKLADGIKKLANTTGQLGELSEASLVTDVYLKNLKNASDSVSQLTNTQLKSAKTLEDSTSLLAQSYDSTARVITQSGTKIAEDINRSGEQLLSTYGKLASTVTQESEKMASNGKLYVEQLSGMNKSLSELNSLYELQLKNSSAQVQAATEVTQGLELIKNQFVASVEDAKVYKEQVAKLSQSISELNSIYGNMLSAMNIGSR